ncbi:hypothetical protein SAMN03080601_00931 [Alkalitalea saponilacus]|uniref:Capsule assembly protein Wzi n=2 Tax=Alkalitalea saponilacus TaxID=889453 RepID=A0A1T5CZN2_9BACT|nr:hypothetical protein SAMN03080601_00931 [Alkalitalea saponilacus]
MERFSKVSGVLKYFVVIILFWIISHAIYGQRYSIYNHHFYDPITRELYKPGLNIHTSIKPLRLDQIDRHFNTDSLIRRGLNTPNANLNIWQRFIHDDLFRWEKDVDGPIVIRANPMFNLELGKELDENINTWINTRAVMLEGQLGENLAFYADFHENQAVYPRYIREFVDERGVIPGQGRTKPYGDDGFDYSQSTGYLSYNAGNWINLQLGYGKNFIGDGHRSLLLSDNTFSYPYFKMTATFWNLKYKVMVSQLQHKNTIRVGGDERFDYKYGVFHYLSWNIGERFSLGLFESVIWAAEDETGYRGMDMNYLIPTVIYRPVEFSLGSPDNVTMGLNLRYIPWNDAAFYAQYVMGEFKFDEVFSGDKWWANKQGFQIGYKDYNFLNIRNLDVQTEYSQVRPYTYSHYFPITNYGHFNQELAHPLGANFRESVSFLTYRWNRWYLHLNTMYAIHGKDFNDNDDQYSYGGNIFAPNLERPYTYGHEIGQGLRTTITQAGGAISYLINPVNNMNLSMGLNIRSEVNDRIDRTDTHFYVAFRTSLRNIYYNF